MTTSDTLTLIAIVTITVAVPVLLIALAEVAKRHIAFKERRLELAAAEATAQVRQLEERMRVLERIATDKGADVAAQIESLRHKEEIGR
jgi:hypothetical protein